MNCIRIVRGVVLCSLFTLLLGSSAVRAWGCKGHQTVALIAEKHLSPEARQLIEKLLNENPVDPQLKRYCGNASRDILADVSTWPDDVRNDRKNGPWHYIDIPRGVARGKSIDEYCGAEGCVTRAIVEQVAIFKDKTADPHKRADAVRYIVHFVGDLHMPLHATTNDDEGGNCVPVRYFRRRPHERGHSYSPNLHSLWDTAIVERDMEGAEPPEYSEYLEQIFSGDLERWQKAGIHLDDWAWESHNVAESYVYGELVPAMAVEPPVPVHSCTDDNNIGERMLQMHFYAGQNYQEIAGPVVEERLALAGVRLAMILNEAAKSLQP
ncbi:MAG TPA: S1/P1 nuclease [Candidatus Acidoferrum sp.]